MAEILEITIPNQKKLLKLLQKMPTVAHREVFDAIDATTRAIRFDAVDITPRDTGRLVDSITPEVKRDLTGRVFTNVEYARAVHDFKPEGGLYKNPTGNKRARKGFLNVATKQNVEYLNQQIKIAERNIERSFKL